jgi:hypothetical protein
MGRLGYRYWSSCLVAKNSFQEIKLNYLVLLSPLHQLHHRRPAAL